MQRNCEYLFCKNNNKIKSNTYFKSVTPSKKFSMIWDIKRIRYSYISIKL